METTLKVRPLSNYPVPETQRRTASRFKTTTFKTLKDLDVEFRALGVRTVILEADFTPGQLRISDSWPKADARPTTPRVVLSFEHPEAGPLRYPCDRYLTWWENVRAIQQTLEALRAVSRHGVVQKSEQYRGFTALPAPRDDLTTAAMELARYYQQGDVLASAVHAEAAIRAARWATHPDRGGNAEAFERVQVAARRILQHHA